LVALAAAAGAYLPLGACSRHVEIYDYEIGSTFVPEPTLDAGDIPALDSGLESDAFPPCAERPSGTCAGPVDFPCQFASWATDTADRCHTDTNCKTNGWLEVTMGPDGCVTSIGMDQPNDEMIACLLAEFGSVHCPCTEAELTYFFGLGNMEGCESP
jgi:hypothetical protein